MALVSVPYDFVGGTRAIADQVDANFAALVNYINTNARTVIQANTTFYVSPTGSDVTGNGLSPSTPAATMTYIINLIQADYDLNSNNITIQLANGTYNENVTVTGLMTGQVNAGHFLIQGNMASPSLVVWNGDPCFRTANGALATVQGVTMQSTVSQCLLSEIHARMNFNNIIFGPAAGNHLLAARGGTIIATGNYTINGGAQAHARTLEAGEIFIDPPTGDYSTYGMTVGVPTVTITGTPNFTNGFAIARNLGMVRIGAAFTGTATGSRWQTAFNGVINILGQGDTYLPGNAAGADATGGQHG